MVHLKLLYSLLPLLPLTTALNPLFLSMNDPACDSCQDRAYNTCPGSDATRPFAECMCALDGATIYVGECIPKCTAASGLGADFFVVSLYTYCIGFFPEYCQSAKDAGVTESIWEKYCGAGAASRDGSGSGSSSGSGSGAGSGSGSGDAT